MNEFISLSRATLELGVPYPKLYALQGVLGAICIDGHLFFRRADLPAIREALADRSRGQNRSAA